MTLNLDTLHLDRGDHDTRNRGVCLMEAVAWWAGEPHTDQPRCVSPVLATFVMSLNDRFPDDRRQRLKPLIPLLPGTAGDGLDERRGYLALDWLVRTFTPAWLDLAGLAEEAAEMRGLRRIVGLAAAEAAGPVVRASAVNSREKQVSVGDGAWDAVGAVAGGAAGAAARRFAELAIARPLSAIEAGVICGQLAERDIPLDVRFEIDGWVHLWPTEPCDTAAEVMALREFALVTDQRIVWHSYAGAAT
jgi:hypothetical protein